MIAPMPTCEPATAALEVSLEAAEVLEGDAEVVVVPDVPEAEALDRSALDHLQNSRPLHSRCALFSCSPRSYPRKGITYRSTGLPLSLHACFKPSINCPRVSLFP